MYVGSVAVWGSDFRLSSLGLILLAVAGRAKRGTQYTAVCACITVHAYLRACAHMCVEGHVASATPSHAPHAMYCKHKDAPDTACRASTARLLTTNSPDILICNAAACGPAPCSHRA